jgi:hypothetical protein
MQKPPRLGDGFHKRNKQNKLNLRHNNATQQMYRQTF